MSALPTGLRYHRPPDLSAALQLLEQPGAVAMAGGQSLLAAMKLGMNESRCLVDLQALVGLREIRLENDHLLIGAMASHADIAQSEMVRQFAPGLAQLAGGIADQQVRNLGTLGGSLANNDPAACWPAAVLACGANLHTQLGQAKRCIQAVDFFEGVYSTALQSGELITAVEFLPLTQLEYIKLEQPASRFALVGVAVAQRLKSRQVTVAVTGLGSGVIEWQEASQALTSSFSVESVNRLEFPEYQALADLHASAGYRAHLVAVLTRRCVALISKENTTLAPTKRVLAAIITIAQEDLSLPKPMPGGVQMQGTQELAAPITAVWLKLLDPAVLSQCILGCEAFEQTAPNHYSTTVKVGIGPVSARFSVMLALSDLHPPKSCCITFSGSAGALGSGSGTARVVLTALGGDKTHLQWQAQTQVTGKLAQFGSRLIQASANKMSADFFKKFAQQLASTGPSGRHTPELRHQFWRTLQQSVSRIFQKLMGRS